MTKKELLKFIDHEIGWLETSEDENSMGELYISEARLKELGEIVSALKDKVAQHEKEAEKLRYALAHQNEFQVVQEQLSRWDDKQIETALAVGNLIFVDSHLVISGCTFHGRP